MVEIQSSQPTQIKLEDLQRKIKELESQIGRFTKMDCEQGREYLSSLKNLSPTSKEFIESMSPSTRFYLTGQANTPRTIIAVDLDGGKLADIRISSSGQILNFSREVASRAITRKPDYIFSQPSTEYKFEIFCEKNGMKKFSLNIYSDSKTIEKVKVSFKPNETLPTEVSYERLVGEKFKQYSHREGSFYIIEDEKERTMLPYEKMEFLAYVSTAFHDFNPKTFKGELRTDYLIDLNRVYNFANTLLNRENLELIPDQQGKITGILLQYPKRSQGVEETFRTLLQQTGKHTHFTIAVEDEETKKRLEENLKKWSIDMSRIEINVIGRRISIWARDSHTVLKNPDGTTTVILLPEKSEQPSDPEVIKKIDELKSPIVSKRTRLVFAGGDILSDKKYAFIGEDYIKRNVEKTGLNQDEIIKQFENKFGKKVIVIGSKAGQPAFHIDMVVTPLGDNKVLLADPTMAIDIVNAIPKDKRKEYDSAYKQKMIEIGGEIKVFYEDSEPTIFEDMLDGTVTKNTDPEFLKRFQETERQLKELGFEVIKLPYLEAKQAYLPYFTYNNALIEESEGKKIAYVPSYGIPELDNAAHQVYQKLGYEVKPIDTARISPFCGTLRCVTNVHARE